MPSRSLRATDLYPPPPPPKLSVKPFPSCLLCELGSSVAPSDFTPFSLQASQQRLTDQWRQQLWQQLEDQVGRCAGQAAPRHASYAGEGKSPASLCGCLCPALLSPWPRGGGGDREASPRPNHPGSGSCRSLSQSGDCKLKAEICSYEQRKPTVPFGFGLPCL